MTPWPRPWYETPRFQSLFNIAIRRVRRTKFAIF